MNKDKIADTFRLVAVDIWWREKIILLISVTGLSNHENLLQNIIIYLSNNKTYLRICIFPPKGNNSNQSFNRNFNRTESFLQFIVQKRLFPTILSYDLEWPLKLYRVHIHALNFFQCNFIPLLIILCMKYIEINLEGVWKKIAH